jgi:hypothetical protein
LCETKKKKKTCGVPKGAFLESRIPKIPSFSLQFFLFDLNLFKQNVGNICLLVSIP